MLAAVETASHALVSSAQFSQFSFVTPADLAEAPHLAECALLALRAPLNTSIGSLRLCALYFIGFYAVAYL